MPFNGTLTYICINIAAHPPTHQLTYLSPYNSTLAYTTKINFLPLHFNNFLEENLSKSPSFSQLHTLGPSVTYGTSANPFQTLSPSPTKFRSHDRYTPFMCGPGHSNMLAQTIPKSWPTHYLRVILNLGRDQVARYYQANVQPDWTA